MLFVLNDLIVFGLQFFFSNSKYNKTSIFLGLIEYKLNSLLGASHLVEYISVHIQFDLERYVLIIYSQGCHKFAKFTKFFPQLSSFLSSKCYREVLLLLVVLESDGVS